MYKIIKGENKGDIIELNDRRAKSELRHGNVEVYKEPKKKAPKKKTKEQKFK